MNQIVEQMIEQINRKPEREMFPLFMALGAKKIVYSDKDNKVQFSVRGDKDVNKVVVTLNAIDTYDIEFWKIRGMKCEMKERITDIYNDQLTDIIWRRVVIV